MTVRKKSKTHDKAERTLCGKKRRQGDRSPCRRPAGWGTDHVGVGPCKLHGGSAPISSGRYSQFARERLGPTLEKLRANSAGKDPADLTDEVELVRACIANLLDKSGPSPVIVQMLEQLSRIADRIDKQRRTRSITLEALGRIVEQMGVVVSKHVKDPAALAAIERDWGELRLSAG